MFAVRPEVLQNEPVATENELIVEYHMYHHRLFDSIRPHACARVLAFFRVCTTHKPHQTHLGKH